MHYLDISNIITILPLVKRVSLECNLVNYYSLTFVVYRLS